MASRMGAKVAMVGCLGDDSFGASYLGNLKDNGIDCDSVHRTQDAATGVAQICVEDSGCVLCNSFHAFFARTNGKGGGGLPMLIHALDGEAA